VDQWLDCRDLDSRDEEWYAEDEVGRALGVIKAMLPGEKCESSSSGTCRYGTVQYHAINNS